MSNWEPAGGRPSTGATVRGLLLIAAAVVLGVFLLNETDSGEPFRRAVAGDDASAVTDDGDDGGEEEGETTTTTVAARDPATVTVLVANGSSVRGAAGRISETLKGSNYVTAAPVNTKTPANTSRVYYRAGYEADARAVAALLTPSPEVAPMPDPLPVEDLGAAHVLVVVAADLAQT